MLNIRVVLIWIAFNFQRNEVKCVKWKSRNNLGGSNQEYLEKLNITTTQLCKKQK